MRWWNNLSTTQKILLTSTVVVMSGLFIVEVGPILIEMLKDQGGQVALPANSRVPYPAPVLPMVPEEIFPTDAVKLNTPTSPVKSALVEGGFFQPPEVKQVSPLKEQSALEIMSVDQIRKKMSVNVIGPYKGHMVTPLEKDQYLVAVSESIHKILETDPSFAIDFQFVFSDPSYRIELMPIKDTVLGVFKYLDNKLIINLKYADIPEFTRTMRHEINYMKMKRLFMSVSANQLDDLEFMEQAMCPYYILPEKAKELEEKFLFAFREDNGLISKISIIYKKNQQQQALTKAEKKLLEKAEKAVENYIPSKIHKTVTLAEFEREKQNIAKDIEEKGYAIRYIDPHKKVAEDKAPLYFKEYESIIIDGGEEKMMYKGYSTPNPWQNKLQAFLEDYKNKQIIVLSLYGQYPSWIRDLEFDTHLHENGKDINDFMFPNRRKFHLELDKLIQQKLQTNEKHSSKLTLR